VDRAKAALPRKREGLSFYTVRIPVRGQYGTRFVVSKRGLGVSITQKKLTRVGQLAVASIIN
jgi:hypothetical protein